MDNITFLAIFIVIILFIILCTSIYKEKLYPTTTYVNTPTNYGVYPNTSTGLSRYSNNVINWSNTPASAVGLANNPNFGAWRFPSRFYNPYSNNIFNWSPLANIRNSGLGYPILSNTNSMMGPMLTSIKSTRDNAIGQWVYAGTAYTENPNDFTNGTIYQLNLDPSRELFKYSIRIKDIGTIPINLPPNHNRLEDGDKFKIQGMEGKGDFVFSEEKYRYVYV